MAIIFAFPEDKVRRAPHQRGILFRKQIAYNPEDDALIFCRWSNGYIERTHPSRLSNLVKLVVRIPGINREKIVGLKIEAFSDLRRDRCSLFGMTLEDVSLTQFVRWAITRDLDRDATDTEFRSLQKWCLEIMLSLQDLPNGFIISRKVWDPAPNQDPNGSA